MKSFYQIAVSLTFPRIWRSTLSFLVVSILLLNESRCVYQSNDISGNESMCILYQTMHFTQHSKRNHLCKGCLHLVGPEHKCWLIFSQNNEKSFLVLIINDSDFIVCHAYKSSSSCYSKEKPIFVLLFLESVYNQLPNKYLCVIKPFRLPGTAFFAISSVNRTPFFLSWKGSISTSFMTLVIHKRNSHFQTTNAKFRLN